MTTIPLEQGKPMQMAIAPNGKYAYLAVSNASASTASGGLNRGDVIDISTDAIVATIPI